MRVICAVVNIGWWCRVLDVSCDSVWCRRAKWSVNSLVVDYSACLLEICICFCSIYGCVACSGKRGRVRKREHITNTKTFV